MSRQFVLPLIAGLFVAGGALAAPLDSWTELDPRVRGAEEMQLKAQKSERAAAGVQAAGKYDFIDRTSP